MTYRTDPWMALCADRACIACGKNDGTVVAAHANEQRLGKGMGVKAHSWTVVPLCAEHHFWLDNLAQRDEAREMWAKWWAFHMMALCEAEMVVPVGYSEKVTPFRRLPKILPRDPGPRAA